MSAHWFNLANDQASSLLESIWRASWHGAIVIAIVWVLCRVWKRIPNNLRCTIWLIVCIRLFISLTPTSVALAVLPAAKPTSVETVRSNLSINTEIPLLKELPIPLKSVAVGPFIVPARTLSPAPTHHPLSICAYVAMVWLLGVAIVAAFSVRQLISTRLLVRRARPCSDPPLIEEVASICRSLGLRRVPQLLITDQPNSILTFGALRPVILLSQPTLANCSEEEWRMVVTHECAHIRRHDACTGMVPQLAQTLFFFHPLVWLACREFALAREASCDEWALSVLKVTPDRYGHLLLKLGSRQRTATNLCTPGVSSHFQLLRRRIVMLENTTAITPSRNQKRTAALVALACLLCAAPITLVQGQIAAPTSQAPVKAANSAIKATVAKQEKPAATAIHHSAKAAAAKISKTAKPALVAINAIHSFVSTLASQASANQNAPVQSVKVFHLTYAKAEQVAEILGKVLDLGHSNLGRAAADPRTNSIIVSADEKLSAQITDVIRNLDKMSQSAPAQSALAFDGAVTVCHLQYASAESLSQLLSTTFSGIGQVVSDSRTNSLVITAPAITSTEIHRIVSELDRPTPPDGPSAQRNKLYKIPAALFGKFGNKASQIVHGERIETVSYGNDENYFIVRGTQAQLEQVDQMERQIRDKNSD